MNKKAFVNQNLCVACGCCLNACRINAISIPNGVCAIIDSSKCIGCGMCSKKCPASIITVREVKKND